MVHPTSHQQSGPQKATSWALCSHFEGREGPVPAFAFLPFLPGPFLPPSCGLLPTLQLLFLGFPWICRL